MKNAIKTCLRTMKTLENYLNRHIEWFTTNGNKMHRISKYSPTRKKDYKTRNERVRWLHEVILSCETSRQLKAAERLAELFAIHHNEKFSASAGLQLDRRYSQLDAKVKIIKS